MDGVLADYFAAWNEVDAGERVRLHDNPARHTLGQQLLGPQLTAAAMRAAYP